MPTGDPPTPSPEEESRPRDVVVLDIDGVLADVRHRLSYLTRRPKDWDGFFAAAAEDPLLPAGAAVAHDAAANFDIVYLTGRPERIRRVTARWLQHHGLPTGQLLMRGNNDRRPSRKLKVQRLRAISSGRRVALVVDDDVDVVKAVRAAGFAVRRADWMTANAPDDEQQSLFDTEILQQAQENLGRT